MAHAKSFIETPTTYKGRQSWNMRSIYTQGPHKVRVSIKVDAYVSQSHAKVEVWHAGGWTMIHSIPSTKMQSTKEINYVDPTCVATKFATDCDLLMDVAEKILF